MQTATYILWNKIKTQINKENNPRGIYHFSEASEIKPANELANAGFIKIEFMNSQVLRYYVEALDKDESC